MIWLIAMTTFYQPQPKCNTWYIYEFAWTYRKCTKCCVASTCETTCKRIP